MAAQSQRERILAAILAIAAEQGYRAATVEAVIARARVSRRSFYTHFDSIEDCFAAVIDEGLDFAIHVVTRGFSREGTWEDKVLATLEGLLVFFDSEPVRARVWMIEAVAAGSWAFERRERHLSHLRALIVSGRETLPGPDPANPDPANLPDSPANIGVLAGALAVIHTHLLAKNPEPLITLLGALMGIVTASYMDAEHTALQVSRGEARTHELLATAYPPKNPAHPVEPPGLLLDPRSHRARACLQYLAEHPDASNREVADGVGIPGHTQISKLLARLAEMQLISKQPGGPGRPNKWRLTDRGAAVAATLA
ncbi:MAG: TetR family transcriptional regulator [Solirubrobacteraceae bacterium]